VNNGNSVVQKVLRTISEHNMINRGERILAAVSGGADSVCMLYALKSLKDTLGFDIYCAHLNHNLRGEDADSDEKFVIELCGRLEIPVFTKSVDVADFAEREKLTLEEAGRILRYEFFSELSQKYRINKIATAHNKNDNAETVLMRIIRGTGIDGLKGISYKREDGVIRPLLDVSRREIEDYCTENNITYCTDKTNFDNDYTRNKIRNELLPYLGEKFNPEIAESLCRLSENAKEDAEFLNGYARRLYERLKGPLPAKKPVMLHIESLKMTDKSIAARVFKIAADEAKKGIRLERKHIDDIFLLMDKETGAQLSLPCGVIACVQYGWLTFESEEKTTVAIENKDLLFMEVVPPMTIFAKDLDKNISFQIKPLKEYNRKVNETVLDYDKLLGKSLFLRNRRNGDRMVCFSDGKAKKIKNILIDEKVPRKDRDRILLLCSDDEVLAMVGSRVSEKYKVTNETERALVIEYGNAEK